MAPSSRSAALAAVLASHPQASDDDVAAAAVEALAKAFAPRRPGVAASLARAAARLRLDAAGELPPE